MTLGKRYISPEVSSRKPLNLDPVSPHNLRGHPNLADASADHLGQSILRLY